MANELLSAALDYAARGFPVFPCNPATKQPYTGKGGYKNATTSADVIRSWWSAHPDAMIAIPTGEPSGAWVLDVDDPPTFEAACPIELPVTRRCRTGKGYHLYFLYDAMNEVRNSQLRMVGGDKTWPFPDLPGAEVRGNGGYVIAPPSLHPSGKQYVWEVEGDPASAPDELLRIVRKLADAAPAPLRPPSPATNVGFVTSTGDTRYGLAGLDGECEAIRRAGNGAQEGTLNTAALKVGGLIAGGLLTEATAKRQLIAAGTAMPSYNSRDQWTMEAVREKVERGIAAGKARPKLPAERMRFAVPAANDDGCRFDPATGELLEPGTWQSAYENNARSFDATPVDLWAHYAAPSLPAGLLPEVIERFGTRQGEIMGADPAGLAMSALAVCSAAVPDRIALQVKSNDPTWRENTRLWVALVGPPSRKKTPIFKAALAPLRVLDNNLMRAYLDQVTAYDALPANEKKSAPRPKQRRLMISDATIEAVQEVLRDSPDGVLSEQDELSGWFGAMDKYAPGKGANAERAFWLKSYNGGTYNLNRIARGSSQIPNLSVSLLGGIQPEPIRKLAAESVDDGLVQRLLPVILSRSAVGKDVRNDGVVAEYHDIVGKLHLMRPPSRQSFGAAAEGDAVIHYDSRAKAIREQLEHEHLGLVEALESISPKLASHFGKYDGLFARLCLLWHCIEHTEGLTPPAEICEDTAVRVAQFMKDFLRPSAIAFYAGLLGLSAGHEDIVALASLIVAKRLPEVKARDAQSSTQSFRSMTADQFRLLCEKLEAFGWLEKAEPGPKSVTPRWLVNPRVHDLYADRAEKEMARRSAAREALAHALQA